MPLRSHLSVLVLARRPYLSADHFSGGGSAVAPEARLSAEKDLTQNINTLIGMADNYPELRASSHFTALRDELVGVENRITAARRFYNLAVGEYGATLRQFPGSLIARYRKLAPRAPFDLGIERILIDEPPAIKF